MKHALNENKYFKQFEKTINEVNSFYMSHSAKRIQYLREMSRELDIKFYEIHQLFHIRFVTSYYDTLQNLNRIWKLLILNLQGIIDDEVTPPFDLATKNQAEKLKTEYKNKHFLLILHFFNDILIKLKGVSLQFQKRGESIIGQYQVIENLKEGLKTLKNTDGSLMSGFLRSVNCIGITKNHCDIDSYESLPVKWQGIDLIDDGKVQALSLFRLQLIDSFIKYIDQLFPSVNSKNFDVFLPFNIPKNAASISGYGLDEITAIYQYFKWRKFTLATLLKDWNSLLNSILNDQTNLCAVINSPPHIFWSKFLNVKQIWTVSTSTLIKTVLVLAIHSSDSERSFSYLTMFENSRDHLSGSTLDSLIRIRMNSPREVWKFKAHEYARHWIYDEKKIAADAKTPRRKEKIISPGDNQDNIYYDGSTIF